MKLTRKNKNKKNTTKKHLKINSNSKISTFLKKNKKLINKCPYTMNLLKNGSKSLNQAGMRISELGSQIQENYGQLFFYDLVDNAMRVPHWHSDGDEIGLVLNGKIRVTIWNGIKKEKHVFTVEEMGSWFIPRGTLHCLENFSVEKTRFLVCYNNPNAADRDFIDAWVSVPNEILSVSTNLSREEVDIIKNQHLRNRLSKYEPTSHLASKVKINSPFSGNMNASKPLYKTDLGEIRRININNAPEMKNMAWQKTIIKPGALRLPHWYTNANVLLYVNRGSAFVSLLDSIGDGSQAKMYYFIVKEGSVIALPTGFFHCLLNISDEDLEYYEAFMSNDLNEITLLGGIQSLSNDVASGSLGISVEQASKMNNSKAPEYIVKF
jgi:oxalate decarboxylase